MAYGHVTVASFLFRFRIGTLTLYNMARRKPVPQNRDSQHSESANLLHRYSASESENGDPFAEVASAVEDYADTTSHPPYSQTSTGTYRPYKSGQYLEPIITGETLQLAPEPQSATSPEYIDSNAHSNVTTPIAVTPTDHYYYHSNNSYSTYSQTISGVPEVEHFRYDTEAYASGLNSGPTYHPPRSRSPTPAVDEEDYYVVGNGSVHYVGLSPEKAAVQQDYHEKDTNYYSERGYLANGQPVVFDPEPETPTSTLNSLPPETPLETRHFGPAPTGRAVRRHKTKRRVQLTNGNLVIDLQVPPKLVLPWRGNPEMTETRYTAVTCDPDDFEKKGFFLRQNESGRRTELFIVITMYNVSCSSSRHTMFADCIEIYRRTRYYFVEQSMV
jgi:chitin synthase